MSERRSRAIQAASADGVFCGLISGCAKALHPRYVELKLSASAPVLVFP